MKLTAREQRIVEHLATVAKGKMMIAESYRQRTPTNPVDLETFDALAAINAASAGGIVIAIAVIQGRTPSEVELEFFEDINDGVPAASG